MLFQLAGTLYTEVVAQHYIVALQFRGGAREADLALVHDVVAVANRERSRQVLLDQENSQALLFQSRQHLDDLLHDHGRKSLGWLVEKKYPRVASARARLTASVARRRITRSRDCVRGHAAAGTARKSSAGSSNRCRRCGQTSSGSRGRSGWQRCRAPAARIRSRAARRGKEGAQRYRGRRSGG